MSTLYNADTGDEDWELPERTQKEITRKILRLRRSKKTKIPPGEFKRGEIDGKIAVLLGDIEDEEFEGLHDRLWYNRHIRNFWSDADGTLKGKCANDFHNGEFSICDICKKLVDRYGRENLITHTAYEAGLLYGKHCAGDWIAGMDWDDGAGDT
jgi:hypothetical protein